MDVSIDIIKQQYDMPFLEIGMNVIVDRKACKITGVSNGGLKGVLINYGNKEIAFHPTYETTYYDKNWCIIKDFRQ